MTNPGGSDYDKQFHDDLEKATALSMETLAMDQFRRNKLQYSHSDVSSSSSSGHFYRSNSQNFTKQQSAQITTATAAARPRPDSANALPYASTHHLQNSASSGSIAPPPIAPPRRASEIRELRPRPNADEPDLISFSLPSPVADDEAALLNNQSTSTAKPNDPAHESFLQMVGEMHKLNAQLHQAPPYGFHAAVNLPFHPAPSQSTQMVPFTQPTETGHVPLTAQQLDRLYSMNYAVQPVAGGHPGIQNQAHPPVRPFGWAQPSYRYGFMNPPPAAPMHMAYSATPTIAPTIPSRTSPLFGVGNNQSTKSDFGVRPQVPPRSSMSLDFSVALPVVAAPTPPIEPPPQSNSGVIRRRKSKANSNDLIDLDHGIEDNSRVSVLEAFDPLLMGNTTFSDEEHDDKADAASDCATSYYSESDPFDYLYSCGTQYSDPVYDAVNRIDHTPLTQGAPSIGWHIPSAKSSIASFSPPPPLPPRNHHRSPAVTPPYPGAESTYNNIAVVQPHPVLDRRKVPNKLYNNVLVRKTYDPELMAFYTMVKRLRAKYVYSDVATNVGHVVAAEFSTSYPPETSIKLLVHPSVECVRGGVNCEGADGAGSQKRIDGYGAPVAFTCDIMTTVEHVIMHVFCELEGQIEGTVNDYSLKPIGVSEWLACSSQLSQLECVHQCLKLEQDVHLGLCLKSPATQNAIGRTMQDDQRDSNLKPEDIVAHEPVVETINYDNLMILLETLEDEIAKLESAVTDAGRHTVISCSGVVQAVKMVCALLGSIDTLDITTAIADLKAKCASSQPIYAYRDPGSKLNIVSESGDYAEVSLRPRTTAEQISHSCDGIRDSVQVLLETYTHAFRVDFFVNSPDYTQHPVPISKVSDQVMVHLMCLHRPPPNWSHDDYMLGAQIYHGTRYIGDAVVTQCSNEISGLFPRLTIDSWLNFESISVCTLPRESRLIFVLYGCTTETADGDQHGANSSSSANATTTTTTTTVESGQTRKVTKVELGWSSLQFFDFDRNMVKGSYLLSLWPPTTDKFLGPAPAKGTHPRGYHCPVLSIEIPNYGGQVVFPSEPSQSAQTVAPRLDFNSLDRNLQQELIDTAELGYPSAVDKREVLWEKRYYLQSFPHALPKVLHAAHSWDFASLVDLHALVRSWQPLSPLQSLELFLPRYPDMEVRAQAVRWISAMPNDQLVDFLPQLLQALKHDTYEASPMAAFLLGRALESPRIAHHLYWQLVHSLPGDSPQNSSETLATDMDVAFITQARYTRRNQMMLRALLATCGEKLAARFLAQDMMCKSLADCALSVKNCKDSLRQKTLIQGLETVHQVLMERPTALPLGPGMEVVGVSSRSSSYFNSATLPLKINFMGSDRMTLPAIFKAGDDLQQDMLTIQLVRIMDKLWLNEGLDLKIVTFNCVPTGSKKGMIEMISEAETLRKIQVEWGLTGSFKDKPIAEWLARQNPSQLEYQRAVDNFTVSCAGYSVATYILGICDRHNDNIMLKTSGHLFHIDFGKFLGDAQMFGNFKRDRTPFVLTSDMAYVINGGDRPSTKFHHFVDLCCQAFNIVRKHGDLILHMLALMATSGIPGVTADAVNYVRNALLPGQSNPEAAAAFAKMIHISLKSWFTQFNFFLHNLAQLRFSGDDGNGELLNFVPRTYTMAQDGRLKSVTVHGFQKRYDLEKYYTYILKVTRQSQPDPAYLFRSYKEFSEFHQKLCLHYPLAKLHSLPSGIHVGRSNIKTVAERRLPEIRHFLISLFNSADEIAHSDLVYTFFHPLLRDQQEQDIHVAKVKDTKPVNPKERVGGEIKLSLQYHRGALTVMIHHARSLPVTNGGQEPNTYVKAYLKPDPTKVTKRKTKVVRKNCFPSYMETLEYRMPIESMQPRVLQVTVWSHDSLQENEFLGGVELPLSQLDLSEEFVNWFPLKYLSRS